MRQQLRALLVEQFGEGVVVVARVAANGVLQQRHRLRRPDVGLRRARGRRIRRRLRARCCSTGASPKASAWRRSVSCGDLGQARALDRGRGAEEELVDERARQADGVEDLRAAIGLVGRDAHLRHDLEQALVDRLDEALDRPRAADRLGQVLGIAVERLEGEIGIDRLGAVAGEAGEVMDLARLAGFDDEADRGAQGPCGSGDGARPPWRAGPGSGCDPDRPCGRTG